MYHYSKCEENHDVMTYRVGLYCLRVEEHNRDYVQNTRVCILHVLCVVRMNHCEAHLKVSSRVIDSKRIKDGNLVGVFHRKTNDVRNVAVSLWHES